MKKKIFRARNVFLALLVLPVVLPTLLFAGYAAVFAYRINSCSPGDHVIQSEADAIEVAKKKIVKEPYFSSGRFGSAPDFVGSLARTENCCRASRSRTVFGVIVWEVALISARPDRLAMVALSNCGDIFVGNSFVDAD